MKTLNDLFYDIILLNELDGDTAAILRFSHAEGGTSGYSFGLTQLDVKNNDQATACLRDCGFTDAEIQSIKDETVDPRQWNSRLNAAVVQGYDTAQLAYCLDKAIDFGGAFQVPMENPSGILALADYINQYGLPGHGSADFYRSLGHPVTAQDVLIFKLGSTKYGKEHSADCKRRYDNIMKVLAEAQDA